MLPRVNILLANAQYGIQNGISTAQVIASYEQYLADVQAALDALRPSFIPPPMNQLTDQQLISTVVTLSDRVAAAKAELEAREADLLRYTTEQSRRAPAPEPEPTAAQPTAAQLPVTEEVPPLTKQKPRRDISKLSLPYGTTLRIGAGDPWDMVYEKEGFYIDEVLYKTPYAVGLAHSKRITEKHPKETKPGDGWFHIKVTSGQYKGIRLDKVYDLLNPV